MELVQFIYRIASLIRSVHFTAACKEGEDRACVTAKDVAVGGTLGLAACEEGLATQNFTFAAGKFEIGGVCLGVGDTSKAAGPYMGRDLLLRECTSDPSYITWEVDNR